MNPNKEPIINSLYCFREVRCQTYGQESASLQESDKWMLRKYRP